MVETKALRSLVAFLDVRPNPNTNPSKHDVWVLLKAWEKKNLSEWDLHIRWDEDEDDPQGPFSFWVEFEARILSPEFSSVVVLDQWWRQNKEKVLNELEKYP